MAKRTDGAANWPLLGLLALVAMVLASYLPAMLWGDFVWDDLTHVPGEPALRDFAGLKRFWFAPYEVQEPHYRPLTYTTFWLEHKLWGFAPNGYHVVNVLLHAANSVLLWRILLALGVPGAWLVAAVFAVHPLHVESVAWVIERKDVLSGLFYLACVATWLRFQAASETPTARSDRRRWRYYGLALTLLAAGMLAKNMVVTLPAGLLVLQWWRSGRVTWTDMALLAPFFAIALSIVTLDMLLVTSKTPASFDYSFVERLLTAASAVWFYVGKLAWPADLAVIYSHWESKTGDPVAWLLLALGLALAAILWRLRNRLGRGPLAGALFFVVTLSPTLGFIDHTYMLFSIVADRYQYLAGIGVMAVAVGSAVYGARRLPDRWRRSAAGASVVLLGVLGALTWRQASIYSDEVTFFQHIVERNPKAVGAHLNLSKALTAQNRLQEAAAAGRIAVTQMPDSQVGAVDHRVGALVNLSVALGKLERFDEAEGLLRQALEIAPEELASEPLENLAVLLSRRNEMDEAEEVLRRALEIAPDDLSVLRNLAKLHQAKEQPEAALRAYDRLVELRGGDVAVHTERGQLLFELERYDEALTAWQQALAQAAPSAALSLHVSMGLAEWSKSGAADAAAPHYERALAIAPDHAATLGDLASLRIAQERFDDAAALFERAIEQAPDTARLHAGRGYALYRAGRAAAAIESLERALALDAGLDEAHSHLALARQSQERSEAATR